MASAVRLPASPNVFSTPLASPIALMTIPSLYTLFDSGPGPCYCAVSYEPALLLAQPHLIAVSQRD
jgi:hypothetical protein